VAWKLGTLAVWLSHGLKVWPWPWDLFMACDCGKCFDLKGMADGQAYLIKKVSKFFPFLLAI
jgi:hypothetical protein